ncbi:Receptor-binding cancer antigen expressed on SiSo cells [Chamberlinius hualienensis]
MIVWFAKIGRLLLALIGVFRRMLCCFRRRRRNSDTPLPLTVKDGNVHHIPTLPADSIGAEAGTGSWTSWDDVEAPSSITVVGNNVSHNGMQRSPIDISEPEVDFFQDMTPEIRKTNKILRKLEPANDATDNISLSNRFAAESYVPLQSTSELGQWCDEEGGWEDSVNDDLTYHADAALRESKLKERERRAAENLKRKQVKDALRNFKKDQLATKIS